MTSRAAQTVGIVRRRRLSVAGVAAMVCACTMLALAPVSGGQSPAPPSQGQPSKLFTQGAARGSLVPTGRPGEYRLTLRAAATRTMWFHNRPGNGQGTIANRRMIELLFGDAQANPRNAAIHAWDPRRGRDVVMGVALLRGRWVPERRVLRYRVEELEGSHGKRPKVDATLPPHFEQPGVFIDEVCAAEQCVSAGEITTTGDAITKVFVQNAARGTFAPTGDQPGEYWLTLRGAAAETLWFQDRPGRLAGTVPNEGAIDPFFHDTDEEAPNAAIHAWDPRRNRQVVLGVKVLDGSWDPATRTLTYRVRKLHGSVATGGSGSPQGRLSRRFSRVGFFIDDCDVGCQSLIGNLIDLANYLNKFFGDRQTCTGIMENLSSPNRGTPLPGDTAGTLTWQGDDSAVHDSWDLNPARVVPYTDPVYDRSSTLAGWTTVGGWLRDCWNLVKYSSAQGSVSIGTYDPYYGSNNYDCQSTGVLRCFQDEGHYFGDHLVAEYCILNLAGGWAATQCRYQNE